MVCKAHSGGQSRHPRGARERIRACEGRKPYGDRDGEQVVIERMREPQAQGFTERGIARELNQEGHATRLRGQCHGVTVKRVLKRAAE